MYLVALFNFVECGCLREYMMVYILQHPMNMHSHQGCVRRESANLLYLKVSSRWHRWHNLPTAVVDNPK